MGLFNFFRKKKTSPSNNDYSSELVDSDKPANSDEVDHQSYVLDSDDQNKSVRHEHVPVPYQVDSIETHIYKEDESDIPSSIPPNEYKMYVFAEEGDTSILDIPETKAIHEVPPPNSSAPPHAVALPTRNSIPPISQELENLPSVFREETYNNIQSIPSERAIGPVHIPSLIEAAAMYRDWIFTHQEDASPEACSMWEAYLELCPNDIDAHVGYGWVIFELFGLEDAILYFRERLSVIDSPIPVLMALADLSTRAGDYGAAAQYYMEVNELSPQDIYVLESLAHVQREAGFEQAALETEMTIYDLSHGVWRGPEQD